MFQPSSVRLFRVFRPSYALCQSASNANGAAAVVQDPGRGRPYTGKGSRRQAPFKHSPKGSLRQAALRVQPPTGKEIKTYEQYPDAFLAHKEFIQDILGYTFQDDSWLKQALSLDISPQGGRSLTQKQLRLALVGDGNLRVVYYTRNIAYPGKVAFSGAFFNVSSNNTLSFVADVWGIVDLVAEWGWPSKLDNTSATFHGTLVEAIIGAVYMDSAQNHEHTQRAVLRLLSFTEQSQDAGTALDPDVIVNRPTPARPDRRNTPAWKLLKQHCEEGRRSNAAKGEQEVLEDSV